MITSSQKLKGRHRVGDVILVKVLEQLDSRSWIVSLDGTLIQVKNLAPRNFKEGQVVSMKVVSLDPPQLSLDLSPK